LSIELLAAALPTFNMVIDEPIIEEPTDPEQEQEQEQEQDAAKEKKRRRWIYIPIVGLVVGLIVLAVSMAIEWLIKEYPMPKVENCMKQRMRSNVSFIHVYAPTPDVRAPTRIRFIKRCAPRRQQVALKRSDGTHELLRGMTLIVARHQTMNPSRLE